MDLKFLCLIMRFFPVNKNKVFFSSFRGMYNDNPKAVAEELHKQNKDIVQIWEKSNKNKDPFPEYVKVVESGSISHYYHYSTSAIIVENGSGYFFVKWKSLFSSLLKKMKNPKSIDIATWHGTPLKHIGIDIDPNNVVMKNVYSSADYILTGSDFENSVLSKAFGNGIQTLKYGNPRNDILFEKTNNERVKATKKRLGLPVNLKVVLYCPTFRDNLNDSGIEQIKLMDIPVLLETLHKKFGGEWCFVFRSHHRVFSMLEKQSSSEQIINGNNGDDMADYLYVTDCIITDYSGSLFDWALTGKPCFLFAHDLQSYRDKERGFYFPVDDLPFSFAETFADLIKNIESFDQQANSDLCKSFLTKIGNYNDGHSGERVAQFIISLLNDIKDTGDKNLNEQD